MTYFLRRFLKQSALPPLLLIWLLMIGLMFKTTFGWLPWLVLCLFYFLSTAPVATMLSKGLEWYEPLDPGRCSEADAIVVLGGGLPRITPEYKGFQPTATSLERVRYAAVVHRQCGLPILTSGGGVRPEARTMADTLAGDYGIETRWQDLDSLTTWENAEYSFRILSRELNTDSPKVVLVTHMLHMPRSVATFKRRGFEVIPAPTIYTWPFIPWKRVGYWIPSSRNLHISEQALHEYLGMLWYGLKAKLGFSD